VSGTNVLKDEEGDLMQIPKYFESIEELFVSVMECAWSLFCYID